MKVHICLSENANDELTLNMLYSKTVYLTYFDKSNGLEEIGHIVLRRGEPG